MMHIGMFMVIAWLLASAAKADYALNLSALLNTGGLAQAVAIGDVNGDGLLDVVLVNNGYGGPHSNHVQIYLGHSLDGLSAPITLAYSEHLSGERGLVLLNVDDDDALEVVIGHHRQLAVINQDRSDGFVLTQLSTDHPNHLLAAMDINLDGRQDLVAVATIGSYKPAVFYDVLTWSTITTLDVSGQGGRFELAVEDVNDDGLADLLLANKGSSTFADLSVWLHDGQVGLQPVQTHNLGYQHELVSGLATGDFTGDERPDVLLTQDLGAEAALFQQDAFGDLFLSNRIPQHPNAELAEADDLNHDGLSDLVLLHNSSVHSAAGLGVMLQDESGLVAAQWFPLPGPLVYDLQAVALGDLNHDGCGDVVLADHNQGLIVFHGSGCTTGADLSIAISQRDQQWLVSGQHLAGVPVNKAWVDVVIELPYLIRIEAEGCRLRSNGRNRIHGRCAVGDMSPGTGKHWLFKADGSQAIQVLPPVTFTATIGSQISDPNPLNNTATVQSAR
ncbi:FG-GAP repeat domain-containing protein [Marinicella meishanensis]|uniref:FG-GAP repeat domain-containing protein n=1 Tax=Marinicella meishanensis TaxID=2873263 RepID=UPI001CBB06F8|nr:VCBS repeat-containing protein [Marinicella sp. NBU2979]